MASKSRTILLVLANLLIPIAIAIFAKGFFPYKPFLSGLATYDASAGAPPPAPFDKVVFMVVDALRSDFVFSEPSGFTFTQSLIRSGSALPFTAHATAPTITLPRVKALTTGSTPSFLDMILSFVEGEGSSSLSTQDTWLAQMRKKDGKMLMYGDDTWLKLFPDTFDRVDGTSSFFVADFTEVDQNVTRHVTPELANSDWNTMILHYLGLDHIGHKAGPRSPHMIPKQREMDSIVEEVYTAIKTKKHLQNTLFVLAGDHGMNDGGNHGGSSDGETSPALVFVSPKFETLQAMRKVKNESPVPPKSDFKFYIEVEQSDVVPTLAGLLGFPVSRNSLGSFIPDFLPLWSKREILRLLLGNAKQILGVVEASAPAGMFELDAYAAISGKDGCANAAGDMEKLACEWQKVNVMIGMGNPGKTFEALQKWTKQAQDLMSSAATNYSIPGLVLATVLGIVATALALASSWPTLKKDSRSSTIFGLITTLYIIMMFASSYVEEEHNFWYWATSAYLCVLLFSTIPRNLTTAFSIFVCLVLLRIMKRWTQSGQKYSGADSITTWLLQHSSTLWLIVLATYLWNCFALGVNGFPWASKSFAKAASQILMLLGLTFKLAFVHEDAPELVSDWVVRKVWEMSDGWGWELVSRARAVYICVGLAVAYTVGIEQMAKFRRFRVRSAETLHNILTLVLLTQSRVTNIPLFMIMGAAFHLLHNLDLNIVQVFITTLLFQHASFFALGNTNAISTLDLSSAYNGVSSFSVVIVGILTFVSNFTGPIFWASASVLMLLRLRVEGEVSVMKKWISLWTVWVGAMVVGVMAACLVLREHLFVWTVFSPKFLYAVAWGVGMHAAVNIGLVGLLFWLGRR